MMPSLFIIGLLVAGLMYVALPLGGAFMVRKRWRNFRRELYRMRSLPHFEGNTQGQDQEYLVFGTIEGIQGTDKLWIHSRDRSLQISMEHARLYELGDDEDELRHERMTQPPSEIAWRHAGPLPESSPVMVVGTVTKANNILSVQGTAASPVMVVLFEGEPSTVLRRLVWTGRQRNEFWNALTPISFILGFSLMALCIFGVVRESTNRLWAVILTTLSMSPFLILLPPGIGGFFAYRSLWRQGRRARARRDMRIFAGKNGMGVRMLEKKARRLEWAALVIFGISLAVNSLGMFWFLAQLAAVR